MNQSSEDLPSAPGWSRWLTRVTTVATACAAGGVRVWWDGMDQEKCINGWIQVSCYAGQAYAHDNIQPPSPCMASLAQTGVVHTLQAYTRNDQLHHPLPGYWGRRAGEVHTQDTNTNTHTNRTTPCPATGGAEQVRCTPRTQTPTHTPTAPPPARLLGAQSR
jgi:hypothetical protein